MHATSPTLLALSELGTAVYIILHLEVQQTITQHTLQLQI
jgi:hypothetical protein